jgi:hypothetical protein
MKNLIKDESLYFVAQIEKSKVVNFVALLRAVEDNMAFDRTVNKTDSIFEFFVPIGMKDRFLEIMKIFSKMNLVSSFKEDKIQKSSLNI